MRAAIAAVLAVGPTHILVGCGTARSVGTGVDARAAESPLQAFDGYQQALVAGNSGPLLGAAGWTGRPASDDARADVAAWRGARPFEVRRVRAVVELREGPPMEMVWEAGRWRVVSGPVADADRHNPAAVLRRFLWAARAGRWALVRALMPASASARFPTDEALADHLARRAARMARIEAALTIAPAPEVRTLNDWAFVRYGGDAAEAVLGRVDGRWRVFSVD